MYTHSMSCTSTGLLKRQVVSGAFKTPQLCGELRLLKFSHYQLDLVQPLNIQ